MAQSLVQLQSKIDALQAKALQIRRREAAKLIPNILKAIETYGITAQDLFGHGAGSAARSTAGTGKGQRSKSSLPAKYADSNGNIWVGRGKRPDWLREAIAAGRSLEEFAVDGAAGSATKSSRGRGAAPKAAKRAGKKAGQRKGTGKVRYRDSDGNAWTGIGPVPRWLKAHIDAGKSRDAFLVQ